jgi:hypothetical protein
MSVTQPCGVCRFEPDGIAKSVLGSLWRSANRFPMNFARLKKSNIHVCNERLNTKDAKFVRILYHVATEVIGFMGVLKIGSGQ